MLIALIAGIYGCILGFTATPFFFADSTTNAALIAGIFSIVNVFLTAILNRKVLYEARENRREIRGARQASHEATEELRDVKRKVKGDRRTNPPTPRADGKRRGIDL